MHSLPPEEFEDLVEMEENLAEISLQLKTIFEESGEAKQKEIIQTLGKSKVQRLLKGAAYRGTLADLSHLALACGRRLQVDLVPLTRKNST